MSEIAIFVYVPFCKIHCTYCDFNVYANLTRIMVPYADAVAGEILRTRSHFSDRVAKSIYLGGGTPSLLPIECIERILRACSDSIPLLRDAEITLEANPGTMDAAKMRELRALGINRLSLGVQAFDDGTLKRLNRGHTVADAIRTYDDARRVGFDNLNLDFIYGLPLQSRGDWSSTIESALALAPEHLSLYALKVEEGTGLEHQIERGKYPMPDEDLAADMYVEAEERLDRAGYEHYEISNWARRRGSEGRSTLQSKHNLTYWLNEPYLGFGAGAHSSFAGKRYWNVLSPQEYVARVRRSESTVSGSETIDRAMEMAETMFLGLRLARGVVFDEFTARFGEDARRRYFSQLDELEKLGLIEFENERPDITLKPVWSAVHLTPRGRLLSNEVFWRFLP